MLTIFVVLTLTQITIELFILLKANLSNKKPRQHKSVNDKCKFLLNVQPILIELLSANLPRYLVLVLIANNFFSAAILDILSATNSYMFGI